MMTVNRSLVDLIITHTHIPWGHVLYTWFQPLGLLAHYTNTATFWGIINQFRNVHLCFQPNGKSDTNARRKTQDEHWFWWSLYSRDKQNQSPTYDRSVVCRPPKCGEHICWQAASQPWCCKPKSRAAVWPDQCCFFSLGHTYTGNDVSCSISAICTKLSFKSKTYLIPKDQNMCTPPVVCVFISLLCAGVLPRLSNKSWFIHF